MTNVEFDALRGYSGPVGIVSAGEGSVLNVHCGPRGARDRRPHAICTDHDLGALFEQTPVGALEPRSDDLVSRPNKLPEGRRLPHLRSGFARGVDQQTVQNNSTRGIHHGRAVNRTGPAVKGYRTIVGCDLIDDRAPGRRQPVQ